ncbi:sensor histidine kinase, partial [Streptomyces sp. NPDC127574]|uniref:sensor histidine kinase n=1 Tax=Streptomyces sp. NPDC127574 TaxID=3345401 RepID=UPI0036407FA0
PEAVDQMTEVQRIARESQREVRAVVRGYREADLSVELVGAQGVLTAAGIGCSVTGAGTELPVAVQSALGWVVREATTNVLRHGDAKNCAVSLRVAAGLVTLTVENDGAPDTEGSCPRPEGDSERIGGSGLAGLRERLGEVDGVLRAGASGGLFRLTAEVPLPHAPDPEPAPALGRTPEPGHGADRPSAGTRLGLDGDADRETDRDTGWDQGGNAGRSVRAGVGRDDHGGPDDQGGPGDRREVAGVEVGVPGSGGRSDSSVPRRAGEVRR